MKCILYVFTHLMTMLFLLAGCTPKIDTSSLFPAAPDGANSLTVAPTSPANNQTPTITGTSASSVSLKLFSNSHCKGKQIGSGTSDASGAFSITSSTLTEGSYHFSVQATASGGSACSTSADYDLDLTPPEIQFSLPTVSLVNFTSPSVQYFVTFIGSSTQNLTAADINLNKTGTAHCNSVTVTNGTALIATVSLSACTGTGTVGLTIAAGAASDNVGNNSLASSPSSVFNVDNSGITSATFTPPTGTYDSVPTTVLVNYADTILGTSVTASDFSVNGTCSTLPTVLLTSAIGSTATVHLVGAVCSLGQTTTLTANFSGVQDAAGNSGSGFSTSTYTIDNVGPTSATFNILSNFVSSIPTTLDITLNEAIASSSVSSSDFVISGTCTGLPTVTILQAVGTLIRIQLSASTCSLNQTVSVRLNLTGVTDLLGNAGVGFHSEIYTFDNVGPAALSISPVTASYATIPSSVNIVFDEALLAQSVIASDLVISGTCSVLPTAAVAAVSGTMATFTLSGSVCNPGQTTLVTLNGPSITDNAGNSGSSSVNAIYTLDDQGPVVLSSAPVSGALNALPNSVTVFFDEAVLASTISDTNLQISGTCSTLPTASLLSLSGSTAVYSLTGADCVDGEEIELLFDGTSVTDAAGNSGSGNLSTIFTLDNVGPTPLSILPGSASLKVIPSSVSVTFDKSILSSSVIGADLLISGSCSVLPTASVISVSGAVVTFGLTGATCLDNQTLTLSSQGNYVSDLSGNSGSNTQIVTYTKDSTGPVVSSFSVATSTVLSLPSLLNITFNETLLASSVSVADFSISGTCTTLPILSVISVSGQQVVLGLTAGVCLDSEFATLTVNSSGVTDSATNSGVGSSAVTYTIDQSGPTLVSVNPNSGATTSVVTLYLSENIDVASVAASDFNLGGSCANQVLDLSNVSNNVIELSISGDPCNSGETVTLTFNAALVKDTLGNAGTGVSAVTFTEP